MKVTLTCQHCNANFEPKRATAKFCSTKCRVYAGRGNSVIDSKPAEKLKAIIKTKQKMPDIKLCKNSHILNHRGYCDTKGCR